MYVTCFKLILAFFASPILTMMHSQCMHQAIHVLDAPGWLFRRIRDSKFKPSPGQMSFEVPAPSLRTASSGVNEPTNCTLSVGRWDDEGIDRPVGKRSDHQSSYAEVKNIESITLHNHGCPYASSRGCSSSSLPYLILQGDDHNDAVPNDPTLGSIIVTAD